MLGGSRRSQTSGLWKALSKMKTTDSRVTILIPVYNAGQHIEAFVSSLNATAEESEYAVTAIFILDSCEDDTEVILRRLVEQDLAFTPKLLARRRRTGQQLTIKYGLSLVADPICVIVDDDISLDSQMLRDLVGPVSLSSVDMVVAQAPARGFRRLTSPVFWYTYRLISGKKIRGRDLMIRAMSKQLARSVSQLPDSAFSISTGSDALSHRVERIPINLSKSLAMKSRYKFLDRFKLFTELLVVSRRELGHAIVILASMGLLALFPLFISLSIFGLISLGSPATILALIVAALGLINLIGIGATQVSLGLLHLENQNSTKEGL